jgi:SPP1 family predicted phage head-tail adaptor
MQAGKLSTRITIQQRSTTQDTVGQPLDTWTTFATVWADVRTTNGLSFIKEAIRANAEVSMMRTSFRIRYRTGINAGMRVLLGSTVYDIEAVMPDLGNKDHLDLVCEQVR